MYMQTSLLYLLLDLGDLVLFAAPQPWSTQWCRTVCPVLRHRFHALDDVVVSTAEHPVL